jgi:hypothetical protein
VESEMVKESTNDWRMQDVVLTTEDTILPWSGQLIPKGSQLTLASVTKLNKKKHLSIDLPNATALCLSISLRSWNEASTIRKDSKIDVSIKKEVDFDSMTHAFDYIERVFESVILAFTSLEAFVNENIPDDFKYEETRKEEVNLLDKSEIERRLSLDEKLSSVLPMAFGINSPKGKKCWQGYKDLKKIRDRIIHMKKLDRRSSGPEIPTLWHDIFKIRAPHKHAKEVMDFFVSEIGKSPRWHSEYPDR